MSYMVFAVETEVQYHNQLWDAYSSLPRGLSNEFAERFTCTANVNTLLSARFYFYHPTSLGPYTSVTVNVYSSLYDAGQDWILPNTLLGTVTIPASSVVAYPNYTPVDLSSLHLSFRSGDEFFISYLVNGGSYGATSPYSTINGLGLLGANSDPGSDRGARMYRDTLTSAWYWLYELNQWDWGISAIVDYDITHDAELTAVNFYGMYTIPTATDMTYDCDVKSNGLTETNVPVKLTITDAVTHAVVFTDTQYIASLGATAVNVVFNPYSYTADGRYNVKIETMLATDQVTSNDSYLFEQQAIATYPATITYDDGTSDNAYAYYSGGAELVSWIAPPYVPYQLTDVRYFLTDDTWPAGDGSGKFRAVIYDDTGTGGGPGTELYNQLINGTRGAWNTIDVSAANIVSSGSLFIGYRQVGDYPNCPGIGTDETPPFAGENVTFEYDYELGDLYLNGNPNDDYMINATVAIPSPQNVTIEKVSGGNKVSWTAIDGATNYTVKSGPSPETITSVETTVSGTNWTDTATGSKKFYRVIANFAAKGRYLNRDSKPNLTLPPSITPFTNAIRYYEEAKL